MFDNLACDIMVSKKENKKIDSKEKLKKAKNAKVKGLKKDEENSSGKKRDVGQIVFWSVIGILVIIFISQFIVFNHHDKTNSAQTVQEKMQNTNASNLQGLDKFAKCLTDNGAVFYGANWCPHCKAQKEMFGDSVVYVNYVDCASDSNKEKCNNAGIEAYPTWKFKDGSQLLGGQDFKTLSEKTGCALTQ